MEYGDCADFIHLAECEYWYGVTPERTQRINEHIKQCPICSKNKNLVPVKTRHFKLFDYARKVVFEQSGDGSVLFVSEKYEKLSEDFFTNERCQEKPWFIKKSIWDQEHIITFSPENEFSQEFIAFSDKCDEKGIKMHDAVFFLNGYASID